MWWCTSVIPTIVEVWGQQLSETLSKKRSSWGCSSVADHLFAYSVQGPRFSHQHLKKTTKNKHQKQPKVCLFQSSAAIIANLSVFPMSSQSTTYEQFCFVFLCFWDRILLCSSDWSWARFVAQTGLELTMTLLSQLPNGAFLLLFLLSYKPF